jgi:hypothetical protein
MLFFFGTAVSLLLNLFVLSFQIDYPDVQVMKSGQRQQCNNNIDYDHHEGTRPIRRMNSDSVVEQVRKY